ncbi:MAG: Hsp20/alpha crystallin family protein [Gammaproteobacteria bacterium]
MYRSLFPYDIFSEMDRLQRAMQQAFDLSPGIRGIGRGGFPALNIGGTDTTVEVYAFAPGLSPESIDVHLERNTLSLSGERNSELAGDGEKATVHINERFSGRFRRVVNLPDDIDPENVTATYRDGVLRVSIKRKQAAAPRRISIR